MGADEVVVSFRAPAALKREFYRAVGEALARSGERVEIKDVAARGLAYAIAELRGELPEACRQAADRIIERTVRG